MLRATSMNKTKSDKKPVTKPTQGSDLGEYQDWHQDEGRLNRPGMMKISEFQRNERLRHVIFSQQFDRGMLDRICQVCSKMRAIGETRAGLAFLAEQLRYKRAMLYFTQASTRTFLSDRKSTRLNSSHVSESR